MSASVLMNGFMCLVMTSAGALSILGGACDWDPFMTSRKARAVVSVFGRTGARVFYVLLGAACVALGTFFLLAGVVWAAPI